MQSSPEIFIDQPLIFTVTNRHLRGRMVRLGPVMDQILAAHSYPPLIEKLLAEALIVTSLLGSTLKDTATGKDIGKDRGSQMTLQAQGTDGLVTLLVCDWRGGALRGYVHYDTAHMASLAPAIADDSASIGLSDMFGAGSFLTISFDQAGGRVCGGRYQGIVPLVGESLIEAVEHYFVQSEQIPTVLRLAVRGAVAGGLLVQYLPASIVDRCGDNSFNSLPDSASDNITDRSFIASKSSEDWDYSRSIALTITDAELCDTRLSLDSLLWCLFHQDEVRIYNSPAVTRGCRCSRTHYCRILQKFPADQHREMADVDGNIRVDCAFCAMVFSIALEDINPI